MREDTEKPEPLSRHAQRELHLRRMSGGAFPYAMGTHKEGTNNK